MRQIVPIALALLSLAACSESFDLADGGVDVAADSLVLDSAAMDSAVADTAVADTAVIWTDCEAFLDSGELEGVACDDASFGTCETELMEDCCSTSFFCRAGQVRGETNCVDGCEMPVCEDYAPPPPEATFCTEQAQCEDFEGCVRTHDVSCGFCFELEVACASDADCSDADVCVPTSHPCMCGTPGSECIARCTDGSCDDGESCQDGRCVADQCTDGYECPPNFDCAFGGAVDAHGCQRRGCMVTADCDCGECVSNECSSGPGICRGPTP